MKSISLLASLAAVSVLCLSAGCSPKSDGAGTGGAGNTAGTGNSGGSANNAGSGNGGSGDEAGAGNEGGSGNHAGSGNSAGSGTIGSACDGVVVEGNPLYDDYPGNPKIAGQGTKVDPPVLPAEEIAVIGNKLFLNSEEEIWVADLDGADPQIKRLAGSRGSKKMVADLPCADTRFLVVHGIAATADGKLVVVDYIANAVIEITDPTDPSKCASHYVAGNNVETPDPDDWPANQGDVDGPGAEARFGGDPVATGVRGTGLHKITADSDGNYYSWDNGTGKIKKIANDTARTVSTIGRVSVDDDVRSLTFLNGKLYAVANNFTDEPLFEINPTTYSATDTTKPSKNIKTVFRNDQNAAAALFPDDLDGAHNAMFSDLENDGTDLIVSSALGYIWKIGTDGSYKATLAGTVGERGPGRLDFEGDFDPTIPHPGNEWQLVTEPSSVIGRPWLALSGSSLFWSGGIGTGDSVIKFGCQ